MKIAIALLLAPALAFADATAADDEDPCAATVVDPVATPVRDIYLDAQRAACVRDEISGGLLAHALIDTPGFHGDLGGELVLGARFVVAKAHELSAHLRLIDFTFVQNAVNKATHAGVGPLVVGAFTSGSIGNGARAGALAQLELPYTRDEMDTMHISGQLAGVVTGQVATTLVLHGRLGVVGMFASSLGGDTSRFALRAGADLAWHLRRRLALATGAEVSAGWYHGFDHVLLRATAHWQAGERWRLLAGVGVPAFGDERTNAVIVVNIAHDR